MRNVPLGLYWIAEAYLPDVTREHLFVAAVVPLLIGMVM